MKIQKIQKDGQLKLTLWNVLPYNFCRSYAEKISWLTRDSTFDQYNIQVIVNFDDLKLSNFSLGSSHPTRHLLTLVHPAWCCSCTNRSKGSMTLGTVGHLTPFEVVALDSTCEYRINIEFRILDRSLKGVKT